jgi:hypothetical protein
MHTTLKRPLLVASKVKWLSAPAALVLIAFLLDYMGFKFNLRLLEDEHWAFLDILIPPVCFICSSLALGHTLIATGPAWFRVIMISVNILGIAAAMFMFVFAAVWFTLP